MAQFGDDCEPDLKVRWKNGRFLLAVNEWL